MLSATESVEALGVVLASSVAMSRLQLWAVLAVTIMSLARSRMLNSCHLCSGVTFTDSCPPQQRASGCW